VKLRTIPNIVLTAVFLLVSVNAWAQVVILLGRAGSPPALTTMQILVGATASGAAWGSWIGARWASTLALGYGLFSAAMLWALPLVVAREPGWRPDFSTGAISVAVFSVVSAWYLARPRFLKQSEFAHGASGTAKVGEAHLRIFPRE
jgi:hypothetical protein